MRFACRRTTCAFVFSPIDRRQSDGAESILPCFHRVRLTILTEFVGKLTSVKLRKWFYGFDEISDDKENGRWLAVDD